ncbi:aspartyl/glutamyl-tRNA(Asn/Gln) amidotransferase subunit B [bacterium BMS3Abin05]|nr:aspartyl/glutamyl-tRNA(Asn/Gln) amidotransferase subunit B [bacterium BMS3Abin05]GBE28325.1 aspartyl/glutamyl-tRNA(Asn/Gln) amidotransferase subunit B [bacterium BMS3Bbin03]HDZ10662.1 Asp-tRNA(Asn)/Glu-tRNA(Gln) amidotransferase subunit GatB [Bacteroidota bacterium]
MPFEIVIGLEVHAQLSTGSKIFCSCSTEFGAPPNTHVCPVCMGLPGVLPVLNKKVVDYAIRMGIATNCTISQHSVFARKNYFYPDLPKGYQISQYEEPLCENGSIEIEMDGHLKRIGITRIHIEEDAGKSVHAEEFVSKNETLVDLNRCGVPLIEIVSEPDMRSPREAYLYLSALKQILAYLEISDCNMEEGSLRCDANVSLRLTGAKALGVKTEVKNMNSFHGVEKALEYEIERQKEILLKEGKITQQTMLWNAREGKIVPMRSKEEAHDYRYFPEPDLVPVDVDRKWVDDIAHELPELPLQRKRRFIRQYSLPDYDAAVLTVSRHLANFYEESVKLYNDTKKLSNWVMGEMLRFLGERKLEIQDSLITPQNLVGLLQLVDRGTINTGTAKSIFDEMAETGKAPQKIVEEKGLAQVSDASELDAIVVEVIEAHPNELEKYRAGKENLISFFMGQVMKATRGKANPKLVNELLRKKLAEKRG